MQSLDPINKPFTKKWWQNEINVAQFAGEVYQEPASQCTGSIYYYDNLTGEYLYFDSHSEDMHHHANNQYYLTKYGADYFFDWYFNLHVNNQMYDTVVMLPHLIKYCSQHYQHWSWAIPMYLDGSYASYHDYSSNALSSLEMLPRNILPLLVRYCPSAFDLWWPLIHEKHNSIVDDISSSTRNLLTLNCRNRRHIWDKNHVNNLL